MSNRTKLIAAAAVIPILGGGTQQASASGSKMIVNKSNVAIAVTAYGRVASGNGSPVTAIIPPKSSVTLQYGDDQNPYLNELQVQENFNGSTIAVTYLTTATGGPGTLDNTFNVNSTLELRFVSVRYTFHPYCSQLSRTSV